MKFKKSKKVIIIFGIIVLLPFLVIIIDGLTDDLFDADFAVVLGNKVEPNGEPSKRLKARLDAGLDIYKKGMCRKIIVSGGVDKAGYDEARVMKKYLVGNNVPEDDIIEDSCGINTYYTGKFCAYESKKNNWSKGIVVTQYFHISRSRLALKRFGIKEVGTAHAKYFELRDIYSTFREIPGYIKYSFRKYDKV